MAQSDPIKQHLLYIDLQFFLRLYNFLKFFWKNVLNAEFEVQQF